jgi:hypothetical protein
VASASQTGENEREIDDFSDTLKYILSLIGGMETTTGFCMHSDLMMSFLLLFVAVAVNAITFTLSGMTDLTSPSLENSRRKVSPLQNYK